MAELNEAPSRKAGRPHGSFETTEALAKRDTQQNLKLADRLRKVIETQLERVEAQLDKLDASVPDQMEEIVVLTKFLLDARETIMRSVRETAKIAASNPSAAGEGDLDAAAKELVDQLKGDM